MDATFVWKLSKLGRLGSSRLRYDDDFVDRLNYQFTGVILFLFIGLISIRQYIGKPIQCWIPQEFTRGWEEYAENYCWVASTYYAAIRDRLPHKIDRDRLLLGYYQWAPIFLALQALLCYLPCLCWRALSLRGPGNGGINLRRLMQMAASPSCDSINPIHSPANTSCRYMGRYITNCIIRRQIRAKSNSAKYLYPKSSSLQKSSQGNIIIRPQQQHSQQQSTTGKSPVKSTSIPKKSSSINCLDQFCCPSSKKSVNPQQIIASADSSSSSVNSSHFNTKKSCCCCCCCCSNKLISSFSWLCCCFFCCCCPNKTHTHGNYLASLYLGIKVLYLFNILFQLYLMQLFIGTDYIFYGIRLLLDLINGRHWNISGHFPRVTFCDMEAKKLGKNNHYTLQCVLPMNMFLEKIFIFLWFWHVFLAIITTASLICWASCLISSRRRLRFIRQQLRIAGTFRETDLSASRQFVLHYLKSDVIFVLKLIGSNIGELLVTDLTNELWNIYRNNHFHQLQTQKRSNEPDDTLLQLKTTMLMNSPTYTQHNPSFYHHSQRFNVDPYSSDLKLSHNLVGNSTNINNNNSSTADKNGFNNNHDDIV